MGCFFEVIFNCTKRYAQTILRENNGINNGINPEDSVEISDKQKCIVLLIKENPTITTSQLAERMGATADIIENNLRILKGKGVIEREGSKKSGKWILKKITHSKS